GWFGQGPREVAPSRDHVAFRSSGTGRDVSAVQPRTAPRVRRRLPWQVSTCPGARRRRRTPLLLVQRPAMSNVRSLIGAVLHPCTGASMNPWTCAALISTAGGVGGILNALTAERGLSAPRIEHGIWCPGAIGNVIIGAFSAFASWAFYGSGASIELAAVNATTRDVISLKFSALAGALLVGVAGARWLSNEVDKRFLK